MAVTNDGDVLPCSHGAGSVGSLLEQSAEEIWNGPAIREVRASILRGEVHRLCRSRECPFQHRDVAFPEPREHLDVKESFARAFDEIWYLEEYADVREAVKAGRLVSGLEHFIRHGRQEGRRHCLRDATTSKRATDVPHLREALGPFFPKEFSGADDPIPNAILALIEYSSELTTIAARPVDVIVVVSTICNLSCVMCPQGMRLVDRPRHTPVALLDRAAAFVATASRMIVSGIAEPLLAPAFWRLLELVSSRDDIFIRVNSNGHSLTEETARKLVDSRLSEISFSLDAATQETYARIRGADIRRPLEAISLLLRLRSEAPRSHLEVFMNMTLMRENLPEAPAFVSLAKRLGVDGVIFSQLFGFGDRPDWKVAGPKWTFVYSEQMIGKAAGEARVRLSEARKRAGELAVRVISHSNVQEYLDPPPDTARSPDPSGADGRPPA